MAKTWQHGKLITFIRKSKNIYKIVFVTWAQNAVIFTFESFLNELNSRAGSQVLERFVRVDSFAVDADVTRAEQDEAWFHAEDDAQTVTFDVLLKRNIAKYVSYDRKKIIIL